MARRGVFGIDTATAMCCMATALAGTRAGGPTCVGILAVPSYSAVVSANEMPAHYSADTINSKRKIRFLATDPTEDTLSCQASPTRVGARRVHPNKR